MHNCVTNYPKNTSYSINKLGKSQTSQFSPPFFHKLTHWHVNRDVNARIWIVSQGGKSRPLSIPGFPRRKQIGCVPCLFYFSLSGEFSQPHLSLCSSIPKSKISPFFSRRHKHFKGPRVHFEGDSVHCYTLFPIQNCNFNVSTVFRYKTRKVYE